MRDTSKRSEISFSEGMREPFAMTPREMASFSTVNSWKYSGDGDCVSMRSRLSNAKAAVPPRVLMGTPGRGC